MENALRLRTNIGLNVKISKTNFQQWHSIESIDKHTKSVKP